MRWDVYKMESLEGKRKSSGFWKTALAVLFIAGITLFHTYVNFLWQKGTGYFSSPPESQHAWFLGQVKSFQGVLSDEGVWGLAKCHGIIDPGRSPLLPFLALPLSYLTGTGSRLVMVFLIPFTFLFFLATYLIGRKIFSSSVGLLASILLVALPAFTLASRTFSVDYPAAAFFTLGIFFLLRSGFFQTLISSVLFGILAGLTFLCRPEAALYFLPPLALGFLFLLLRGSRLVRARNILIALGLCLLMSGYWFFSQYGTQEFYGYLHNVAGQARSYASAGYPNLSKVGNVYLAAAVNSLSSFPIALFVAGTALFALVILSLSVLAGIFSRKSPATNSSSKRGWLFLLAIVLGSTVLLILHFPEPKVHHLLPFSGLLAVAAGRLALAFPLRILTKAATLLLLLIVLFNYVVMERGILIFPEKVTLGHFLVYKQEGYLQKNWKPEENPGLRSEGKATSFSGFPAGEKPGSISEENP